MHDTFTDVCIHSLIPYVIPQVAIHKTFMQMHKAFSSAQVACHALVACHACASSDNLRLLYGFE